MPAQDRHEGGDVSFAARGQEGAGEDRLYGPDRADGRQFRAHPAGGGDGRRRARAAGGGRPGRVDGRARERASACASSGRSEEHTSELQSLMRISYAVFCLKKKITTNTEQHTLYQKTRETSSNVYAQTMKATSTRQTHT